MTKELKIEGRIDAHKAPELRKLFDSLYEAGVKDIYLNVQKVSFIDSSGLAAIVSALKMARSQGGEFYLINPSQAVTTLLNYTMLDQIIPVKSEIVA